jgi:DNA polymerase III epsilon subunit-like protein
MAAKLLMSLSTPMPATPSPESSKGGSEPSGPEQPAASGAGRRHYGRRRGSVPVGDSFVARLGPAGSEPFAAIDDPDDEPPRGRPGPETPIDELRFVAVDCETTGQTPHRLVELGAVAFTLERHLLSMETLVHSNDRINPFARRIHGISSETLGGAPPVRPVLERFRRFCRGAVLVEHSADAFDSRLIATTLGESLEADNLDTSRLAARLFDLHDTIGLERLCTELSVSHRRPHHALADAEATMGCFLELVRRGREQFAWRTLGDLLADGQPPPPRWADDGSGSSRKDDASRRRRGGRRHRRSAEAGDPGAA